MTNIVSPQRMRTIDPISYGLWQKYVKPYVKRSRKRTSEIKELFASGPLSNCSHPAIKKIIENRLGVAEFQEAMMTWNYLAAMCRYHERALSKQR